MLAHLNTDGENQHLQHTHRGRHRAFTHFTGEQRQAYQASIRHANTKRVNAQPRRHPQVRMGRGYGRHRRDNQPCRNGPAAHNNQRTHGTAGRQTCQHQVTDNQRAKNRHL